MKKLAAFAIVSLAFAAPVFACPNMDHETPKTADKPKDAAPAPKDSNGQTAKAKDAPKEQPKPADTAKTKDAPAPKEQPKKTGDKVSSR